MHIYVSDTENLSSKEEDSDFLGRQRHSISQFALDKINNLVEEKLGSLNIEIM